MTTSPEPRLGESFLRALRDAAGRDALLTDPGERWPYSYDNSRREALPDAVVVGHDHTQIAAIVACCYEHSVPLTTRGLGSGTTGAAVPTAGGVVLTLERMNRILRIRAEDRFLVAEPGCTNQQVQEAAGAHRFFWPPDPTSSAYATLGGNLAYNSAGPRAVKYGTPRENTLALRAVTGTGESLRTGVYTTKGVVGYDLTRLLIGSEGTLAVMTEATLKLTPLAETKRTLKAVYRDMTAAARAVSAIMAQPVIPCALEFIDHQAIEMVRQHSQADLPRDAGALLMIEVDGPEAGMDAAAQAVADAAANEGLIALEQAATEAQVKALWATRKALSPALRNVAPKKINEDVVVPVSRIPELIDGLAALSREYGITIVNFGHAGNGNIHVNLLVDPEDHDAMERARLCLDQVFDLVLGLEGSLSGEHGVGLEKRAFVDRELDPVALRLMRAIKADFDPANILNPGKMLP